MAGCHFSRPAVCSLSNNTKLIALFSSCPTIRPGYSLKLNLIPGWATIKSRHLNFPLYTSGLGLDFSSSHTFPSVTCISCWTLFNCYLKLSRIVLILISISFSRWQIYFLTFKLFVRVHQIYCSCHQIYYFLPLFIKF